MASAKQIAANQRNAKFSTGPKSPEAKAKTRLNAKRDGFTGQIITLSDEDRTFFEKFQATLLQDLAPQTVLETSLATSIAWDTWRLNRIRAVETNMFALKASAPSVEKNAGEFEMDSAMSDIITYTGNPERFTLMTLYQQRMERSIHKNLTALRQLQAERKQLRQRQLEDEITLARANDINGLPCDAPLAPLENGYVFSNREILTAAHRLTALKAAKTTIAEAKPRVQFAAAASASQNASPAVTPYSLQTWPQPQAA